MAVSFTVLGVLFLCSCCFTVNGDSTISIRQHVEDAQKDDYYCTKATLPTEEGYIIEYRPHLKANVVHHMLLYGCSGGIPPLEDTWDCEEKSVCPHGTKEIIYAWALQANGLELPKDVGFKVGGTGPDNTQYIVMEIHYHDDFTSKEEDIPILDIVYTNKRQNYVAGIFLIGFVIRHGLVPGRSNYTVDAACEFRGPNPIHPFAFRTHTHTHGTAMYGYVVNSAQEWQLIGSRSPQDAQAFYPVKKEDLVIHPGNFLASRTYYDTTNENQHVQFGAQSNDEMCNFYIMYYTDNNGIKMFENSCWDKADSGMNFPDSEPVLPVHGNADHSHTHHHDNNDHVHHDDKDSDHTHHIEVSISSVSTKPASSIKVDDSWPFNKGFHEAKMKGIVVGDVTAVDVDSDDNVYVLHRMDAHWNVPGSFDENDVYMNQNDGPISGPVLLKINSEGELLSTWGRGVFYLPHGLRISTTGQYWFTDVARHQILKTNDGMKKISVLGSKFVPGVTNNQFCKPADVELDENKNFFYVADGYCNHRVMVYSLAGDYRYVFPSIIDGLRLLVPHSLALINNGTELYVADRENQRIVVYNTITKEGRVFVDENVLHGKVFGIAFSKSNGVNTWPMYAINGSVFEVDKCAGFTINEFGQVIDTWGPSEGFKESHDIAVSVNGQYIYVVQLQPQKVWRMKVNSTNDTTNASTEVQHVKPSHSSSSNEAMDINTKPIPATMAVASTVVPPPSYVKSNPQGQETSIASTSTAAIMSHSNAPAQSGASSEDSIEEEAYRSLFVILLIIGGVVWVVLVCAMCIGCYCARKIRLVSAKQQGNVNRHYSMDPGRKLRSLMKGSRNGFTPVNAQDSDSDEEETILFQQHKT